MTFNRYTVHSAVPSTKVQLLKSPHGFIAVIDTGKYLITNTGTKTTMSLLPDIKMFDTIGTSNIYNSTAMYVVNTSNQIMKAVYSTNVATATWTNIGTLPTSNISNYFITETNFICFDTTTKLVYKAPLATTPLVFTSSSIYGELTEFMEVVGTPTDVYTDYLSDPTSPKQVYVSGVNKIDGNMILKNVVSMVPCINIENPATSIVQNFHKDTTAAYSTGAFTASTRSDITFNLGFGRFLFIKNNGEILFTDSLNNKLKSWNLVSGTVKVNAHKLTNNVLLAAQNSSGGLYLYTFDLRTESMNLDDFSLYSTYLTSRDSNKSSKINSYNNYIGVLVMNSAKTGVDILISTNIVDTNVKDYKISTKTRVYDININTELYPALNTTQLYNVVIPIFMKNFFFLTGLFYMMLKSNRYTTTSTYILNDVNVHNEMYVSINPTTGGVSCFGGTIPGGEDLSVDAVSLYFSTKFGINYSSILTTLNTNGYISSGNLYWLQTNTIKILKDDLSAFYEYIKETTTSTEKTLKLTYFDYVSGTTKEWGAVNVKLTETN